MELMELGEEILLNITTMETRNKGQGEIKWNKELACH